MIGETTISTARPLSEAKRKLLDRLMREKPARPMEAGTILPRRSDAPAPLALSQEQVVLRDKFVQRIPLYNEFFNLKYKCAMDRNVLECSIAEVLRRHEIWRTSYRTKEGQLVQVVHPAADCFPLAMVDLRGLNQQEREAAFLEMSLAQTAQPFDLENGPLLCGTLAAMTDSESWLAMTAHQSIVDGVSVYQIFPVELFAIYQAFAAGRPSPLSEIPLQFSDYACWQRQWFTREERDKQIAYWRGKLAGEIPVLSWPETKAKPSQISFRGYMRSFMLPRSLSDSAHALCRSHGATMFVGLLAAFYTLLHLHSGQTDLVVGTFSPAGRKRSEVQKLLGYFLNPVALRVDLSDDPTFVELLRRIQIILSEAISNDDVPFEHVVEELQPVQDPSRKPYFNFGISLQPGMPDSADAWSVTSMDAESGGSMLDLYIAFIDRPEGLHARVQYNPDLFELNQMRQMIEDFQSVLENAAARPEDPISKLRPRDQGVD